MRTLLATLAAASLVLDTFSAASAADDKKLTPQQEKSLTDCVVVLRDRGPWPWPWLASSGLALGELTCPASRHRLDVPGRTRARSAFRPSGRGRPHTSAVATLMVASPMAKSGSPLPAED